MLMFSEKLEGPLISNLPGRGVAVGFGVAVGLLVGSGVFVFVLEGVCVAEGFCVPMGGCVPEATCVAIAIWVAWFLGRGALVGNAVCTTACNVSIPCVDVAIWVSSAGVLTGAACRLRWAKSRPVLTNANSRAEAMRIITRRE